MRGLSFTLVLSIATLASTAGAAQETTDPYLGLLARHDLEPTAESLGAYLKSLGPDADATKKAAELIRRLGADDFFTRESAMAELLRRPSLPPGLLEQAIAGSDPEIRWRAKQVAKQLGNRGARLLYATLSVIRREKITGLTSIILDNVPLAGERYLREAARKAIVATVQPADEKFLLEKTLSGDVHRRIVAIAAYEALLDDKADKRLIELFEDDDDRIRMAAAGALADHGHRAALPVLGRLLDSPTLEVRVAAVQTLRGLSGKTFGYVAYEPDASRVESRKLWNKWIVESAPLVTLKFPIRIVRHERGLTLACGYSANRFYEFDSAGNSVWETSPGRYPWGCQGLPNGHRLVALHSSREVAEFDPEGREIWRKTGLPGGPSCIWRLENGNTLIACTDSQRVIELDRSGTTVWDVRVEGRPTDARRLDDGRTLVTLQSGRKVVEVDPTGRIVWEIANVQSPLSAQRLDNGNTLVASSGNGGRVAEYDRAGAIVWSNTQFNSPWCAQRLANGNTLVSDTTGLTEIKPNGARVWSKAISGIGKFYRY